MANYIYEKQISQVTKGLIKVVEKISLDTVVISDFSQKIYVKKLLNN